MFPRRPISPLSRSHAAHSLPRPVALAAAAVLARHPLATRPSPSLIAVAVLLSASLIEAAAMSSAQINGGTPSDGGPKAAAPHPANHVHPSSGTPPGSGEVPGSSGALLVSKQRHAPRERRGSWLQRRSPSLHLVQRGARNSKPASARTCGLWKWNQVVSEKILLINVMMLIWKACSF